MKLPIQVCGQCPFQSHEPHGYCCHRAVHDWPGERRRIDAYGDETMIPSWCPLRAEEVAVVVDDPKCPTCKRSWADTPGTIYCGAQHGLCGICHKPRPLGSCKCLTSTFDSTAEPKGPEHVRAKCPKDDCGGTCNYCCLFICEVCNGGESSLLPTCPGRKLSADEQDAISAGVIKTATELEAAVIPGNVYLSNKNCPRHYVATKIPCGCPPGRCWYDEQQEQRKRGLFAISHRVWMETVKP